MKIKSCCSCTLNMKWNIYHTTGHYTAALYNSVSVLKQINVSVNQGFYQNVDLYVNFLLSTLLIKQL